MSAFLITMAVFFLLSAGGYLQREPNKPRPGVGAGALVLAALINVGFAVWALYLLVNGGAA